MLSCCPLRVHNTDRKLRRTHCYSWGVLSAYFCCVEKQSLCWKRRKKGMVCHHRHTFTRSSKIGCLSRLRRDRLHVHHWLRRDRRSHVWEAAVTFLASYLNNKNRASSRNDLEPCLASLSRRSDSQRLWRPQECPGCFLFQWWMESVFRQWVGGPLGLVALYLLERKEPRSQRPQGHVHAVQHRLLQNLAGHCLKGGFSLWGEVFGGTWSFAFRLLCWRSKTHPSVFGLSL